MSDAKGVKAIWWNGAAGDAKLEANDERTLTWVSEYHGDHECEWVIESVGDREIARHNARYIASIWWLVEHKSPRNEESV